MVVGGRAAGHLARLGLTQQDGGRWNGHNLLLPGWVEASAEAHTPLSEPGTRTAGDGYGLWLQGRECGWGAYAAWGWSGQKLIIMPELDMVVVFTGGSYWQHPLLTPQQMMVGYVLPSGVA